jgi:hypothetical protein
MLTTTINPSITLHNQDIFSDITKARSNKTPFLDYMKEHHKDALDRFNSANSNHVKEILSDNFISDQEAQSLSYEETKRISEFFSCRDVKITKDNIDKLPISNLTYSGRMKGMSSSINEGVFGFGDKNMNTAIWKSNKESTLSDFDRENITHHFKSSINTTYHKQDFNFGRSLSKKESEYYSKQPYGQNIPPEETAIMKIDYINLFSRAENYFNHIITNPKKFHPDFIETIKFIKNGFNEISGYYNDIQKATVYA